ncbi:hypothetical protein C8Q74DRAFT_1281032 [Fomes fomentarius]|nr:hypothetical protein C8Q74DRAFT_1281032 [Fomes fomentarius]
MNHSFVPARLHPGRSAYWLPPSGQAAACRLPTGWFWALRASIVDPDSYGLDAPPLLFLVASEPSPYPILNASLTLGPRKTQDTGRCRGDDAELIVRNGPLPSMESVIDEPLYLHTVPALHLSMYYCPPLKSYYYGLEQDSLRKFIARVEDDMRQAHEYRENALSTYGYEAIKNGWAAPTQDAGRMGFGVALNDPHTYVFDFGPPEATPCFEGKATVYDELMLYVQLCKDYRWMAVEDTVLWTRNMRTILQNDRPTQPYRIVQSVVDEVALRSSALELFSQPNPHVRLRAIADARAEANTASSGSSVHTERLPWVYQHLPITYPFIPMGTMKVVVFDLFGAILDREGSIRNALSLWQQHSVAAARMSIYRLTERYLMLEALNERDARAAGSPSSLATSVRQALLSLAQQVELQIDEHSPLFMNAFTHILNPPPHPEVEAVTHTLLQRGYMLVGLPTHSQTTMTHILPSLPRVFVEHVRFFPECVSMHFVAEFILLHNLFSFCQSLVGGALEREEILVVSTSVGRVLHAAQSAGHATALVQRSENFEGHVEFVVGAEQRFSPRPSVVLGDLLQLVV